MEAGTQNHDVLAVMHTVVSPEYLDLVMVVDVETTLEVALSYLDLVTTVMNTAALSSLVLVTAVDTAALSYLDLVTAVTPGYLDPVTMVDTLHCRAGVC